jgi:hypothetical protein
MLDLCCMLADDDRNDIRIEAAFIKLYASEMAWKAADELVQLRGGRGFETAASQEARGERGVAAEQILRDLRINRIFEGSTEIMHLLIAREAVDDHLRVAGDIIDPKAAFGRKARAGLRAAGFYARWLPTLVAGRGNFGGYAGYGALAKHLRYAERKSRKLARQTFRGMAKWQGKLEFKQSYLARLVDIGAELFAIAATCVRANASGRLEELELADLFCRQARDRADTLFRALHANTDAGDYRRAKDIVAGRYEFIEEGILPASSAGEWVASWEPGPSTLADTRRRLAHIKPTKPPTPPTS